VAVVALGVLPEALMSVLVPGVVVVVVLPAVPAPMEVPLPVVVSVLEPVVPAVLLLPVVPMELEPVLPAVLLLPVSLGIVVDGLVEVEPEVAASSFLPQALRERAAIRARAAHCAIGDLIIRTLLEGSFGWGTRERLTAVCCLRLTLVRPRGRHVVWDCRRL
jgi:hypothetical protein